MDINGNEWEELCEACLQEKYKNEIFIPVTATTHGDWGIDGFTKTGIIFQCYQPEEKNLPAKEHTAKLKNKINTDLKKIEKNKEEIKVLMEGKKIKTWILLTYEILNKDIHTYAVKKTNEYNSKNLDLLDKDFKVIVEPFSFIKNYVQESAINKKIAYSDNIDCYKEEFSEKLNSEYIDNLNKKLKDIFNASENKLASLKNKQIVKYFKGLEIGEKFQNDFPEKYKKVLEVISNFELNLEEDIIILSEDKSNLKVYGLIKEKLEKQLSDSFSEELDNYFILKLRDYYISLWLLHCPLKFEN